MRRGGVLVLVAVCSTACAGADGTATNGGVIGDSGELGDAGSWPNGDAEISEASAWDAGPPEMDAGDGAPDGGGGAPGCPVLAFPTGVHIQTFEDAAMTAEYASIADNGNYPLPVCFIDVDNLIDPVANTTYDVSVKVGEYFQLKELVGTELPYSHKVLVSTELVVKLDAYRRNIGGPVTINSGYRSPQHQRDTCQGICGMPSCPGTCAARSRHSWGDAADINVYPTQTEANAACAAKFNYIFLEGNHLHVDLNPAHGLCTIDIL